MLYAARTGVEAREKKWNPSASQLNATSRLSGGSNLMAIYIDQPRNDGTFKMHTSEPGDDHLDLAGFDVQVWGDKTVRFWLLNQRPPYVPDGTAFDPYTYGANTTIDAYEYRKGDKKMSFVANGKNPTFHSANRIAFLGANNFVVSNERSSKTGLLRRFDLFRKSGSLVYHNDFWDFYVTTPRVAPVPGHIIRGADDRIYVPSQVENKVRVFELQERGNFKLVHTIVMPMAIVSLTVGAAQVRPKWKA